ncbi:TetR/AcrR family transcriptional regulator [Rhabdothermincola salaria]|uniref:TetR/AcrR family transcriptional regulator n=1 Tax=Rhabdothermincola salaria TaxID=2903142 RepID=UPI001E321346|nr:TetR/AcrR family transcriptional regulator [Rhabdothermincola salaria]MCD9625178.1 TetR/AcrR family transcriptional regulator [Rhabdothermincola salaria]
MSSSVEVKARPGRQRSVEADRAILSAAIDELAESGYGSFTVAAVIARAGVSSATLYRRWATKEELVAAALASLHPEPVDIDTGSLEGDVTALVARMAKSMSVRRDDLAGALSTELRHDDDLRAAIEAKFATPRLALIGDILARARDRGELSEPPSAEVAWSLLAGPLHHRAYLRDKPLTPTFVRTTTAFVLAGLRAVS